MYMSKSVVFLLLREERLQITALLWKTNDNYRLLEKYQLLPFGSEGHVIVGSFHIAQGDTFITSWEHPTHRDLWRLKKQTMMDHFARKQNAGCPSTLIPRVGHDLFFQIALSQNRHIVVPASVMLAQQSVNFEPVFPFMLWFVHFLWHTVNNKQIRAWLTCKGIHLLSGYFAAIQTVVD